MGDLERKIMDLLWDADHALSAQEIREALVGDSEKPDGSPAVTTVLTVLTRLQRKGLVDRVGSRRPFQYLPSNSRAEHVAALMHEVLQSSNEREAVLTMFVNGVGRSDTETLRRLINGDD